MYIHPLNITKYECKYDTLSKRFVVSNINTGEIMFSSFNKFKSDVMERYWNRQEQLKITGRI